MSMLERGEALWSIAVCLVMIGNLGSWVWLKVIRSGYTASRQCDDSQITTSCHMQEKFFP